MLVARRVNQKSMFQPGLFQKENFDKAEQLFHIGLKMATDMQHQNGITYVLDLMANLALDVVSQQLLSYIIWKPPFCKTRQDVLPLQATWYAGVNRIFSNSSSIYVLRWRLRRPLKVYLLAFLPIYRQFLKGFFLIFKK